MSESIMDMTELLAVVARNEDSRHQFEELQRLFQSAGLIHGDEVPVQDLTEADIDIDEFKAFYEKKFGAPFGEGKLLLADVLRNMGLMRDGMLNISGALLFAKAPQFRLPAFIVKAAAYPGLDFSNTDYMDSRDIAGRLPNMFRQSMNFVRENIRAVQNGQGINSLGVPEIPPEAMEEIIVNALLHRDYFISAPVRLLIFADRIEVISPGHLPNNLTIENIKNGASNIRNPILASFATQMLPYRGLGSGIIRALRVWPHIEFTDDREGNLFKVILKRRLV